jgi:cytochrome c-type biogenesis protein CcmH/NrfG
MFPGKPQPWLFLGVIHMREGDDEAAIVAFQQSLEVSPGQIEGHMRLGEIYLRQQRGEEAVRAFEAALEVEASFAEAQQQLAAAIALRDRPFDS